MEGSFVNQPISESAAYWWDRANFPVKAARIDESTLEVMYGYEHVERYSGIWIAGGSFVGQGSLIEDCTQIGPGSIILSAQVDSTVSIGDGCFVGEDCRLKGKLSLGTHCYV